MTACYDPTHEPTPERPDRLQGPEVGAVVVYHDRYHKGDRIARVVARSYVWSPEQHHPDGTHGFRRYDWTVIDRGKGPGGGRVVVDDDTLRAPVPGEGGG